MEAASVCRFRTMFREFHKQTLQMDSRKKQGGDVQRYNIVNTIIADAEHEEDRHQKLPEFSLFLDAQ